MPDDWTARTRTGKRMVRWMLTMAMAALLIGTVALVNRAVQQNTERCRASSCQSNLKQLGLALCQYAQDYDDTLPLVSPTGSASLPPFGWALPYLRSSTVLHCPSDTANHRLSYALNARLFTREVAPGVLAGVRRRNVEEPSEVRTIVEAGPPDDGLLDPYREQPVARHGKDGSMIAFLDGMVNSSTHSCMYTNPGKHMWEPKTKPQGANP
ncbi:MAG: DUF1559 domain-containing protein [Armatimonadetes bacterium]|nr:DUF1559 domain-containing protein [Armatimonadota bacterium]